MTKAELKNYLSQYVLLSKEMERKKQELALWKRRSAESDISIDEMEQSLKNDVHRLIKLKKEMEQLIASLEDYTQRLLLEYRYLDGKTWEETADLMNYCWQHLHRIHNKAIIKILDVMECDTRLVV